MRRRALDAVPAACYVHVMPHDIETDIPGEYTMQFLATVCLSLDTIDN